MSDAIGVVAGRYDLIWQAGATLERTFTVSSGGAAVDLSAATPSAKVYDAPGGTELVDLSGSVSVTDGPNGEITLDAPPALTATLDQDGVWDLLLVWGDGSIDRLIEGRVVYAPAVT